MTDVNIEQTYDPNIYMSYAGVRGTNKSFRSGASSERTFLNEDVDTHVKSEYGRQDYEYFRRGESTCGDIRKIIKMSRDSYDNIGIIKNTIDLMSDFASKGMKIVHKNKSIQNFLRKWFKYINGRGVNDRILQSFYRDGNTIIERADAKIKAATADKWKTMGFVEPKVERMTIPYKYVVHNVLSLTKDSNEILSDRPKFDLMIDGETIGVNSFTGMQVKADPKSGNIKHLDPDKIYDYYYKKSDWEVWAKPMTYAIMNELMMLDKIQLADMSALDGAISNVRLWRLGSLEHKIYPNREALDKLRSILAKGIGGGVLDLVWGPELDFKESSTQVHHFLGKEKYEAILTLIYAGLGIPPTLTGSSTGSGFTNNFISLKTLVERLEYGRYMLVDFWEKQLDLIMKAMGFSGQARVLFTYNVLSDEVAEKSILKDMWDRDIISSETLREALGFESDIEQIKVSRESKKRGKSVPQKASPFHSPLYEEEIKKIFVQSGGYAPSEFGVELEKKTDDAPIERKVEMEPEVKPAGNHVVAPNGRPKNKKDTAPRKKRTVKPTLGFLNKMMWYSEAKEYIDKIINPCYLDSVDKENLRFLTKDEYFELEKLKFHCMSNIKEFEKITVEDIITVLDCNGNTEKIAIAHELIQEFIEKHERQPSLEETKQIYLISLAME